MGLVQIMQDTRAFHLEIAAVKEIEEENISPGKIYADKGFTYSFPIMSDFCKKNGVGFERGVTPSDVVAEKDEVVLYLANSQDLEFPEKKGLRVEFYSSE